MITHVAVRSERVVYSLPAPNRHHHILWVLAKRKGLPNVPEVSDEALMVAAPSAGDNSQGFLTDQGEYLEREPALKHAIACGQIVKSKWGNQLYSEDVW